MRIHELVPPVTLRACLVAVAAATLLAPAAAWAGYQSSGWYIYGVAIDPPARSGGTIAVSSDFFANQTDVFGIEINTTTQVPQVTRAGTGSPTSNTWIPASAAMEPVAVAADTLLGRHVWVLHDSGQLSLFNSDFSTQVTYSPYLSQVTWSDIAVDGEGDVWAVGADGSKVYFAIFDRQTLSWTAVFLVDAALAATANERVAYDGYSNKVTFLLERDTSSPSTIGTGTPRLAAYDATAETLTNIAYLPDHGELGNCYDNEAHYIVNEDIAAHNGKVHVVRNAYAFFPLPFGGARLSHVGNEICQLQYDRSNEGIYIGDAVILDQLPSSDSPSNYIPGDESAYDKYAVDMDFDLALVQQFATTAVFWTLEDSAYNTSNVAWVDAN